MFLPDCIIGFVIMGWTKLRQQLTSTRTTNSRLRARLSQPPASDLLVVALYLSRTNLALLNAWGPSMYSMCVDKGMMQ